MPDSEVWAMTEGHGHETPGNGGETERTWLARSVVANGLV